MGHHQRPKRHNRRHRNVRLHLACAKQINLPVWQNADRKGLPRHNCKRMASSSCRSGLRWLMLTKDHARIDHMPKKRPRSVAKRGARTQRTYDPFEADSTLPRRISTVLPPFIPTRNPVHLGNCKNTCAMLTRPRLQNTLPPHGMAMCDGSWPWPQSQW